VSDREPEARAPNHPAEPGLRAVVRRVVPDAALGVGSSLAAYLIWGLFPLYFRALAAVPAVAVLAHRIVWSAVFLAIVIGLQGRWREFAEAARRPRLVRLLVPSALALGVNWGVFLWAVEHGRVLESSLGYFLCPLFSVVFGVVFLKERLTPARWLAVALAAIGVGHLLATGHGVPAVPLALATSWALYGLLRKLAPIDPVAGLLIESLLLAPAALLLLGYPLIGDAPIGFTTAAGAGAEVGAGALETALLVLAGPVTALPLILFVYGTRRITLTTVGLLQYLTPSGHFALAVWAFGEPFSSEQLISFAWIWSALALYSFDGLRRRPRGGT
jgi:chloramphenicol-sensitive protein RarD